MFVPKIILTAVLVLFVFLASNFAFSQLQPIINYEPSEQKGTTECEKTIEAVPLPDYGVAPKSIYPIYLSNKQSHSKIQSDEILKSIKNNIVLNGGEHLAFIINTSDESLTAIDQKPALSAASILALTQVPTWISEQLKFKLTLLARTGLDDDLAQYILDAPENQKDEIAFLIAYTSYQTLTGSNFLANKDLLKKKRRAHI